MADFSPMMKQYLRIKQENPGTILFFRLGDFYEMFFEDAKLVSNELELVLTGKGCGQDDRAPMCGIPYHSCEGYIARLIAKGYKVAICEQTEDPAKAKGLVQREVIRVVTPGTVTEAVMLDESCNNYLSVLYYGQDAVGICFVDASTGQLHATEIFVSNDSAESVKNELSRFSPKEIRINSAIEPDSDIAQFITNRLGLQYEIEDDSVFAAQHCEDIICRHFSVSSVEELGLRTGSPVVSAVGAALAYLFETQKTDLDNINTIDLYTESQYMHLDLNARRNLELFETMRLKTRKGSLLWVLDQTRTAMGKRMLRSWLEQPLINAAQISRRQNAVAELYSQPDLIGAIAEDLNGVFDMERLITRVLYGTVNAREMVALKNTLVHLPQLRSRLKDSRCQMLREIFDGMDELTDVSESIECRIKNDPPLALRDGGLIKEGFSPELDELLGIMKGSRTLLTEMENREREATGIRNLKISYNRVFGYYIEITNSFKDQVPERYIRKQTLTGSERYITEELKDLENKILTAKEKSAQMEYEFFDDLRKSVAAEHLRIQNTAAAVARLDVLCSLAAVALDRRYVCPDISTDGRIQISEGRHPVVETVQSSPFVPNDTLLDTGKNRCAIITGPNMAGKSTYMRQVALITIMAQIGSFVPARSAHIGITDGVYTRVGASDDLFGGQSTFMVEMNEVASILQSATRNSLIILDEIGRGTSTFDGMSIARAVLEYIVSKKLGAKTLFATHYHELTELENMLDGVHNFNVAVKKRGDNIIFLRRIVPGGADRSYGIEVAGIAGIPKPIIDRAKRILLSLENAEQVVPTGMTPVPEDLTAGASEAELELAGRLKQIDINTVTPIEAMSVLADLISRAKKY